MAYESYVFLGLLVLSAVIKKHPPEHKMIKIKTQVSFIPSNLSTLMEIKNGHDATNEVKLIHSLGNELYDILTQRKTLLSPSHLLP